MDEFQKHGYVVKNGILAFQKGPLSQWFGAYASQDSTFVNEVTAGNESKRVRFNCMEQFMMFSKAMVFKDFETATMIMSTGDPKRQKSLGREVKNFDQAVWDENKERIVFIGNVLKFSQNEYLKKFLLSTGDLVLVEAAPWDSIWGCGSSPKEDCTFDQSKWKGENLLGKALMAARERIKQVDNMEPEFKNVENKPYKTEDGVKWHSRANATCIIVQVNDEALILKRGESLMQAGKWCLPCGYVDWNENVYEAASRELYEEAGVYIEPSQFKQAGIYEVMSDPDRDALQNITFHFHINLKEKPEIKIDNVEAVEYKWHSVNELIENAAFNHDSRVVDRISGRI